MASSVGEGWEKASANYYYFRPLSTASLVTSVYTMRIHYDEEIQDISVIRGNRFFSDSCIVCFYAKHRNIRFVEAYANKKNLRLKCIWFHGLSISGENRAAVQGAIKEDMLASKLVQSQN
jgi:hypothetical protein